MTSTSLPSVAMARPHWNRSEPEPGTSSVWRRAPVVPSNTYAAPALAATVSSDGAPTAMFPLATATDAPNSSPDAGVGFSMTSSAVPSSPST